MTGAGRPLFTYLINIFLRLFKLMASNLFLVLVILKNAFKIKFK